ncbi:tetratricopeptide repeat-containing sensor histidine kinase [Zobellia barbeyronii]|uniref:histidine kinase n=1 Tax=Zobellia barbeyronii TaxID=2748009 RepID=A0ABS5WC90_9FLAO|nr:ATP-binding protein [Zobellia barbeyronii]MBT2160528.1 tetratricopeptide repeat protein [Zobellia barbeyronii]
MASFFFANKSFYFAILLVFVFSVNLQGQTEKSTLTKIVELKSSSDFNTQNSDYIDLLLELAETNMRSNPDSTAILLKESYDLSIASQYKNGESIALSTYGYYYAERGETDKASEYNKKALEVANTYDLDDAKIAALNNIAIDFHFKGDYATALTKYLEALAVAEKINETRMMSVLSSNIAFLYSYNEDFDSAIIFQEKARQISLEAHNDDLLAVSTLGIAHLHMQKGNLEESERLLTNVIPGLKKQNRKDWLSSAYAGKGDIAVERKNYTKALEWFIKSEKLCDEIDYSIGYAGSYIGLAESYLGLKNLEKAEEYGLKGLEIANRLSLSKSIQLSNLVLSKIYHEKGEDKKAYAYQNEYRLRYEKEADEKFKNGLGVALSKMRFENQKEQLIEKQNKAIAKQKTYVYFAIAALLVATLFLILIYRTNKLQKKYTKNLQAKQEILIQKEAELCESNRTKDKLFSIIAHDLKGPINSFHSLMKMSTSVSISKEQYISLMPKALSGIQGISELLNNLLIWAKTQMDGIVLEPKNIDLHDIAEQSISVLTTLAQKKEISIVNEVPENTISYSDKNHLDVILRNLIGNAIKFTNQKGEIHIKVEDKDDALQLEVVDNGVGMDLETRSNLFKTKYVKSTFGTNNENGSGLGLSICKEMVENNGGKIWVSSVRKQGTTIYFTVPKKSNKIDAV